MDIDARARKFALGVALAITSMLASHVAAQDFAFDWNPRTGDAAMDVRLADINRYGDRYRAAFVDELVRYHAAPRTLVGALMADEHWAPGDLYFACALAQAIGRPCRHVLEAWRRSHASGWGELAARLGAPTGSREFARIQDGVESSYLRWGRPLPGPVPGDG